MSKLGKLAKRIGDDYNTFNKNEHVKTAKKAIMRVVHNTVAREKMRANKHGGPFIHQFRESYRKGKSPFGSVNDLDF